MANNEKIIQELLLNGADEVARQLLNLGDKGAAAFEKLSNAAKGIGGRLKTAFDSFSEAEKSIARFDRAADGFKTSLHNTSNAVTAFVTRTGALVGAVQAVGIAMFALAKSGSNAASAVQEASTRVGTTPQQYQKLAFAFEQSGSSAAKMEQALGVVSNAIQRAKEAGKSSTPEFERLGISLVDAGGKAKEPLEVFLQLSDEFNRMKSPVEKTSAAIDIFGRRLGPGLIEPLSNGTKGFNNFSREAVRLGLVMTDMQLKVGKDFNDAVHRLVETFRALKNSVGLVFAPGFEKIVNIFTNAIARNRSTIITWASEIASKLIPVLEQFALLLSGRGDEVTMPWVIKARDAFIELGLAIENAFTNIIVPAFKGFLAVSGAVAEAINGFFGTKLSATDIAVIIVLGLMTGAFKVLTFGVGLASQAIRVFGSVLLPLIARMSPWGLLIAGIALALGYVISKLTADDWKNFEKEVIKIWENLKKAVSEALDWIVAKANEAWGLVVAAFNLTPFGIFVNGLIAMWNNGTEGVKTAWNDAMINLENLAQSFATWFSGTWIGQILGAIGKAIDLVGKLADAMNKNHPDIPETHTGMATQARAGGGIVRGAGSSISDSIAAWLSNGEYVLKSRAVKKYGIGLLNAINSMRLSPAALRGYASGGLVSAMAPSRPSRGFAAGSPVQQQTLRPFDLHIGGETFPGLLAPEDTADSLFRYALKKQVRQGGRKPSWVGGKK